ncbi:unnamed protein product (macronuclear) [Paramecium tetraurelia]|uniref:RNase H type-1 domain-containing protein n=1 Tax=Paramecium tetraurelia TaxID=5888 RepID=A0DJQ9_PARTE|nr:uncharacterized protein GSPATT00017620001 [Paramecium tetraurelia]CAK83276.1 unnamed protein product [Paramecium tetraurelia]|eukprot:XP_001450673.1 hypothetical protein (macronuclear) [Paramecium tetraurelia strain d4-2]
MQDNYCFSLGSSSAISEIKSEVQDNYSEISRSSRNFESISSISGKKTNSINNLSLSDLDNQHRDKICFLSPLQEYIQINPKESYDLYYASSTNIQGKFGIIIKNQNKDLVTISQAYPDKTINELEFLATIQGMRYCIDLGIKILNVKGNSQLVTKHRSFNLQGQLAILKEVILKYTQFFYQINFVQIPKEVNNQAKQLSREEKNFVKVLQDQSKIQDLSVSIDQNKFQLSSQRSYSQQNINNLSAILPQKPHLDQILLEYPDIFSEYNKQQIKPINLQQNRDYALIFGKVNDNTNKGANFMIKQDLNEIIVGTFYFPQQTNALQEISLLYGMRFLLECQITYLNCFTNDETFCKLFDNENNKLMQSQIKEQKCLYSMKQLFQRTSCRTIESGQLKALKEPYQNKQSRFQILDESIQIQNGQIPKQQSITFSKFSQIYGFNNQFRI